MLKPSKYSISGTENQVRKAARSARGSAPRPRKSGLSSPSTATPWTTSFADWRASDTQAAWAQIHGGMGWAEREGQVERFRSPDGARYLVATDAAGEGINLQFCAFMANYDIPWNPARLEQRMGRIHRYGPVPAMCASSTW